MARPFTIRKPKAPQVPVTYEESSEIKSVQFGWTANFKIGYVVIRGLKLNLDKKEPWGKFKKVPPLYRGLTNLDAVVEIVADGWSRLNAEQQEALIAHELCHGSMSEKGALRLEKHDLEEFRFVVAQWGAWDEGIKRFGEQLDLFSQRGPTIRTGAQPVQEPLTAFRRDPAEDPDTTPTSITRPRRGAPPATPPLS